MIPLRLAIKGLYSYREEVEIDFERLCEAQLFGIFGPVGSGKSAILEAISYALYGHAERLNARDDRGYNMMNLQAQELLIEFDFKTTAEIEGQLYRYRVRQRRNARKFEEVSSPVRSAFVFQRGEWEPLPGTNAEEVLGLSYDNFIKTIIIPQGRFSAFLHMTGADRTRMLSEIFGLDRFELAQPAKALRDATHEERLKREGELQGLQGVSSEAIAQLQEELQAVAASLGQAELEARDLEKNLADWNDLQKLAGQWEQLQVKLKELQAKERDMQERATRLQAYQQAALDFRELLNNEERLKQARTKSERNRSATQDELNQLHPQIEAAQKALAEAEAALQGRATLETQAADYGHLAACRTAETQLADAESRLRKGQEMRDQEAALQLTLSEARTATQAQIVQLRDSMPDLGKLQAALAWYRTQAELSDRVAEANVSLTRSAAACTEIDQELLAHLSQAGLTATGAEQVAQAFATHLQQRKEDLAKARQDLTNSQRHMGLEAHAQDLVEGQPCPLCGATHHPTPFEAGAASAALAAAAQEIASMEASLRQAEAGHEAAIRLSTRREALLAQYAQAQAQLTTQKERLASHLAEFTHAPYQPGDPTAAIADQARITKLQATLKELEHTQGTQDQEWKDREEKLRKFTERLQALQAEAGTHRGSLAARRQQLQSLRWEDHTHATPDELLALQKATLEKLVQLDNSLRLAQDKDRRLQLRLTELGQTLKLNTEEAARLEGEWSSLQADLQRQLQASTHPDLEAVKAILSQPIDIATERAALDQFQQALNQSRGEQAQLSTQIAGRHYDAEAHGAAKTAAAQAKQRVEEALGEQARRIAELVRFRADLSQRQQLEAEHSRLRMREENLGILIDLFRASGFVKYVSMIYLHELVARADVRFRKLTRNALSLELAEGGEFLVRDMLNGGQTRSVKTLSGGQTFQASLCLALALAENVQQYTRSKNNFFFLDEGFGTLDRESLLVVFDALKQLRQENRVVGVISHIEELQQEIDVYLRVSQTEERGSRVMGSWE